MKTFKLCLKALRLSFEFLQYGCIAAYWLPICNCYMSDLAHFYGSKDADLCHEVGNGNCTQNEANKTPPDALRACECHERCERFAFEAITQFTRYEQGTTF